MATERNVGGYDRIARAVLATVLAVVALSSLRKGRRSAGVLAAVGFGVNAVTCFCGLNRALGIDTTSEE